MDGDVKQRKFRLIRRFFRRLSLLHAFLILHMFTKRLIELKRHFANRTSHVAYFANYFVFLRFGLIRR